MTCDWSCCIILCQNTSCFDGHRGGKVTGHCYTFYFNLSVTCVVALHQYCFHWSFQVNLSGNCLSTAVKKSLRVRNNSSAGRDAPYFPNRYFRRQVVNYMVNHHCLIYENKFVALMSLYGVEETDPSRSWNPPLSFKEYLRFLLRK